jgi:signal transduction histidine kinase
VVLVPGTAAGAPIASASPVRSILGVAWTAVLLAAIAVAWLLVGTLSLGERRSAFVSAVTHELRTPLTTLTTYSEMLVEGMVKDEVKRRHYLETLRREAVRLGHLVENVLSYARIEQGRSGDRTQPTPLGDAVERARPRLEERAAQAGMTIVVEGSAGGRVQLDPVAFEQVLFNLVDNACKYAATSEDKRIHVTATEAAVRVRDHGPGLDDVARKRLFQPFSRSAARAAGRSPGVGLGLALCRRLARAMGGDLRLEEGEGEGATFLLTLRRSD